MIRLNIPLLNLMCAYNLLCAAPSYASVVRHLPTDADDDYSMQSQNACLNLSLNARSSSCVLSESNERKPYGLFVETLAKSREDAIETSSRLLNERLSKGTIEQLFAKDDFLSLGVLTRLGAVYSDTEVHYIPVHILAASRIVNPALPELQISTRTSEVWRVTQKLKNTQILSTQIFVDAAVAVAYKKVKQNQFAASLLDLAAGNVEDFSQKKSVNQFTMDVWLRLRHERPLLPFVSLRFANIAFDSQPTGKEFLQFSNEDRTYSYMDIGRTISRWPVDASCSIRPYFFGILSRLDLLETAYACSIRVEQVESFFTFSSYAATLGFVFSAESLRAGVQYRNEKQDNDVKLKRYDDILVSLAANI